MQELISQVATFINTQPWLYKLLFLFFSTILEYIFPIYPGDSIIILAGILQTQQALELTEIILAVSMGTFVGASISYYLGRFLSTHKTKTSYLKKFFSSSKIMQILIWYKKYGYWFLLLNRFFPGIRTFFFLVAGYAELPARPVLILGFVSGVVFSLVLLFSGVILGTNIGKITYFLRNYYLACALLIAVLSVFVLFYFVIKKINSDKNK